MKGGGNSMKPQGHRLMEIKINTHHRRRSCTSSTNGAKTSDNQEEKSLSKPSPRRQGIILFSLVMEYSFTHPTPTTFWSSSGFGWLPVGAIR
ncbi:hypothetical protein V6N13_142759 [Hibiscus sabdariffa]